jgi:drug/metabolite transporter (DMT)-like permease
MNRGVRNTALAALLFGATTPAVAWLSDRLTGFLLAGVLYLGAALFVAPAALTKRPTKAALSSDWRSLSGAVIAGGCIAPVLFAVGVANSDAVSASLLLNFELVATTTLAALLFKEHIGARTAAAVALVTIAGILTMLGQDVSARSGALLVIAACLGWGLDNAATSQMQNLAPAHIVLAKGLIAGSVNVCIGLLRDHEPLQASAVLLALLVGALGYGGSLLLWISGSKQLGASRGQVIFATAPFIGALVAWLAWRESVTLLTGAGALLAAVGVILSLDSSHGHEHTHEALTHAHDYEHDVFHQSTNQSHHTTHTHVSVTHSHPHLPDLHHRHTH